MSILRPLSFSNTFHPLGHTIATSFVEYLPLGDEAKCLLLGCDPRKILYTVSSERDNAFPRKYDLTCCDAEPAMIARSVFLFTVLIDVESDACSELWNIFHDFYIDMDAMNAVHGHAEKLVQLSETMETWRSGPYGEILHMLNDKTLEILHHFWLKYANASSTNSFRADVQKIARDHYPQANDQMTGHEPIPPLSRSFGMLALASRDVAADHMRQFWENGVVDLDDLPKDPIWNPLFSNSSRFTVYYTTTPLAIYHFAATANDFGGEKLSKMVASAKAQFKAWCDAFIDCIPRMLIKFIIADPLDVCFALSPIQPSIPWSELKLDTETFNVIDTSCLVDVVGGVNLLVATVPLLESSPVASIRMESASRPWSEETMLLRQFLCGDVTFMCNVLGVAPIAYLTKTTTHGVLQDLPIIFDFSGSRPAPGLSRIIWKISSLGDSAVTKPMKISFSPEDFSKFLCAIYDEMFESKDTVFINSSFVALVLFLKRRILVDWDSVLPKIIPMMISHPNRKHHLRDLQSQLDFFGTMKMRLDSQSEAPQTEDSQVAHILFSVPRKHLERVYDKSSDVPYVFEVRIHDPRSYEVYSPVAIFGRRNGIEIEKDRDGWHGSSDLHLLLHVLKGVLSQPSRKMRISFRISSPAVVRGSSEIFQCNLLDDTHVQIYYSSSASCLPSVPAIESDGVDAKLGVKNRKAVFTTRITVNALNSETNVKAVQKSPCILSIDCGSTHICQFPYPVDGDGSTFRLARKSKWVEVSVPLSVPHYGNDTQHLKGGYSTSFLPLTHVGTKPYSWNLPLINFNQLPRIDDFNGTTRDWFERHTEHMFSDFEVEELSHAFGDDHSPLILYKVTLANMFQNFCKGIVKIFGIQQNGVMKFLLFMTGLYLDPSSHNIVAEAYLFETTPEHLAARSAKKDNERLDLRTYEVDTDGLKVWKSSFAAMIERCRDWEHKDTCEYSTGDYETICSCGAGRVGPEFLKVEKWGEFAPNVVRLALSPIFPAPFIEHTRKRSMAQFDSIIKQVQTGIDENRTCAACFKPDATKKCGNCGKVYYCGRECQVKHWKWHKPECRAEN